MLVKPVNYERTGLRNGLTAYGALLLETHHEGSAENNGPVEEKDAAAA